MEKSIFSVIVITISSIVIIFLFYGLVNTIIGNIKAKKLLKILPEEKIDRFRFGTGFNNFKIRRYIMNENSTDSEEVVESKNL